MATLELLASAPGTGKTTYCIDLFRKEILKSPAGLDSRCYFVLPNREHVSRIQNLILKKDVPGLFNVHILTLQDLTQRFLGARAGLRPGEMLRQALIRSILEDSGNTLPYFTSVRDLKGFHELLSETLQEFKAALSLNPRPRRNSLVFCGYSKTNSRPVRFFGSVSETTARRARLVISSMRSSCDREK